MWSINTNKYLGGFIVVAWLLLVVDFVGDQLIPPIEPIVSEASAETVSAEKAADKPAVPEQPLNVLLATANVDKGKKVAKKCVACHSFESGGKNKVGPNLHNILGKNRAGASGFAYSSAIKTMGGKWGFEDMNDFLKKSIKSVKNVNTNRTKVKRGAGNRSNSHFPSAIIL